MKVRVNSNDKYSLEGMVFEVKDVYNDYYIVEFYNDKLLMVPFEHAEVVADELSKNTKVAINSMQFDLDGTIVDAVVVTDVGIFEGEFRLKNNGKARSWGEVQDIVYKILRSF